MTGRGPWAGLAPVRVFLMVPLVLLAEPATADRVLSETVVGETVAPSVRSWPEELAGFSEPEPPGLPEVFPLEVFVN